MNLHPTSRARAGVPGVTTGLTQRCALCDAERATGGYLSSRPGRGKDVLWVCGDCQHKLARRLDDEGALGG